MQQRATRSRPLTAGQEQRLKALKHMSRLLDSAFVLPGTEIRIGLERRNDTVVLEVDDDGEGIAESGAIGKGIGLEVMRRFKLITPSSELVSIPI